MKLEMDDGLPAQAASLPRKPGGRGALRWRGGRWQTLRGGDGRFLRCARHPGTVAYLFRRTYRELEDTLIAEAIRRIPAQVYRYSASAHEMRLVNGSCLRFRHCQNEADRFQYQGAEIHWLYIDELTHFLPKRFTTFCVPACVCGGEPGHTACGALHLQPRRRGARMGQGAVHRPGAAQQKLAANASRHRGFMARGRCDIFRRAYRTIHTFQHDIDWNWLQACGAADALLYGRWDAFEGQGVHRMA